MDFPYLSCDEDNNYLSYYDHYYLENRKFFNMEEYLENLTKDQNNNLNDKKPDSFMTDELASLITNTVKSQQISYEARHKFNEYIKKDGLFYLPNLYLLDNYRFVNEYRDDFKSLSSYFEKYFFNPKTCNQSERKETSHQNKIELIKIISAVIFARLMKTNNIKVKHNSVEEILLDRITTPDFQKFIDQPENDFEYSIVLINLLMMSSLSDIGAIENNILNQEEVTLKILLGFLHLSIGLRLNLCFCQDW